MMKHESSSTKTPPSPRAKSMLPYYAAGLLVVAAVVFFVFVYSAPASISSDTTLHAASSPTLSTDTTDPRALLTKSRYIRDTYAIHRDRYDIFEKSAEKHGETLDETKEFFLSCCGLTSEEDIFSQLPLPPANFSDIAYDIAVGNTFQLESYGPDVYKQPELYFIGTETALVNQYWAFNPWIERSLNYWGEYGGNAFPASQDDSGVSKSGRTTFSAVVFFTNAWNIQNYVGYNLVPDAESQKYFDLTISEEQTGQPYFLLGPTFPRFDQDWATRISVEGKVHPDTPPGTYTIHISPIAPPAELAQKWGSAHPAQYASYGAIGPTDGYITLHITVSE